MYKQQLECNNVCECANCFSYQWKRYNKTDTQGCDGSRYWYKKAVHNKIKKLGEHHTRDSIWCRDSIKYFQDPGSHCTSTHTKEFGLVVMIKLVDAMKSLVLSLRLKLSDLLSLLIWSDNWQILSSRHSKLKETQSTIRTNMEGVQWHLKYNSSGHHSILQVQYLIHVFLNPISTAPSLMVNAN